MYLIEQEKTTQSFFTHSARSRTFIEKSSQSLSVSGFYRWTPSWTWYPHWSRTSPTSQLMILTQKTLPRSRVSLVASSICFTLRTLISSILWVLSSTLKEHTSDFSLVAKYQTFCTATAVFCIELVISGSQCFCCCLCRLLTLTFWFVIRFWTQRGNTSEQVETKGFASRSLLWFSLPTSWPSDTRKMPHWCADILFTLHVPWCFYVSPVFKLSQICPPSGWQVGKEVSEDLFLRSPDHQCTYKGWAGRAAPATLPAGGAGCRRDRFWEPRDCSLRVYVTGRMFI